MMKYAIHFFLASIASVLFSFVHCQAQAPVQTATDADDGWRFSLAPYFWATSVKGTTGVKGIDVDVDVGFDDLIEKVDGALMLVGEARHGNFSITTDFFWADLSGSKPTPRGVLFSDAELDMSEIMWSNYGGYALYRDAESLVEILAGFRLVFIDADLTLDGNLASERGLSPSETWVDPLVGIHALMKLSDSWRFRFFGDIGGFGASSTLTWQALAGVAYSFNQAWALDVGYRAIGYEHDRDGFRFDLNTYGPFLGLEWHF